MSDLENKLSGRVPVIEQQEYGYRMRLGVPGPDPYLAARVSVRVGGIEGYQLIIGRGTDDHFFNLNDSQVTALKDMLVLHCQDRGL